ncbi:GDP-mannose 4,6-dehydratase, partial [Candidatus Berkelbacteria bacterium]|nr:GDP-mannose 4,6-dehydratase [Candidatus Berkelbacteria bacterium]
MKTLITGISGFIGFHLAKELLIEGDSVIGFSRTNPESFKQLSSKIQFIQADLLEKAKIQKILTEIKPDRIFHLAAQSLIPRSFENPQETIKINVIGTLNLLEEILALKLKTIFVSVGSSAEYGLTTRTRKPVSEDDLLLPQSPYGISKVVQHLFIQMYSRAYGLKGIHLRPFAVIGPLKKGDAVSDFVKSIVAI